MLLMAGLVTLVLFLCLFIKYKTGVEISPSDTQLINLEKTIIPGAIYDRNGLLIAEGTETNGTFTYIEDASIRQSFSNIFGLSLPQTGISPFYLRKILAADLYGYETNRLTLQSFVDTSRKGSDVNLTLDMALNGQIYEILQSSQSSAGACVYNYLTGEVIALVSTPSYDLADETTWPLTENNKIDVTKNNYAGMNRVMQECYPPCSMVKPILYSVILEQMPEAAKFQYECSASTKIHGILITDHSAHGSMNLQSAIAHSCNTYAVQMGNFLTAEEFQTALEAFGFGEGLYSEYLTYYKGTIDMSETVNKVYAMLGQGGKTKMSVLQLTKCYGAFFNRGIMMEPYITKDVQEQIGKQVISENTAQLILEGLKQAAEYGTASHLNLSSYGYTCAGKTGTGDLQDNNTIWCTGGFVDQTMPYIVTVCLTGRDAGDTGGEACSPMVRNILELLIQNGNE